MSIDYEIIAATIAVEILLFAFGVWLEYQYDKRIITFDD